MRIGPKKYRGGARLLAPQSTCSGICAGSGIRTRTPLRTMDFESIASPISPSRRNAGWQCNESIAATASASSANCVPYV